MRQRWIALALATLGATSPAIAQVPTAPSGQAAAPVQEPLPFAAPPSGPPAGGAGPAGMYGDMGSGPYGQNLRPAQVRGVKNYDPSQLPPELSPNLPNAFSRPSWENGTAFYVYLGVSGLKRERLGGGAIAVQDPINIDNNNPILRSYPQIANFNDINPNFNLGYRTTTGYHWENQALELTGFYMGEATTTNRYVDPGRIDVFFFNPPLGFEGNNNLWHNADALTVSFKNSMVSAEGNYRWWLGEESNFSWLIGVRYMQVNERIGITTDDEATIVDANGRPDPTRIAEYSVYAHNRIAAPQVGLEYNRGLTHWAAFSVLAKGAWGINFSNSDIKLERGDGLIGALGRASENSFAQIYDIGCFLDFHLAARARLRAGYDALWVTGIAEASGQVDFDLSKTTGQRNTEGSAFYHGPILELQVVF